MIQSSKPSVILVGCGNIGFRYLQGLCVEGADLRITVVEPNPNARRHARSFIDGLSRSEIEIKLVCDLAEISGYYDVAIVATTAVQRLKVVKELLANSQINYIILEKLLSGSTSDLKELSSTLKGLPCWVNTPFRIMPLYKKIKELIRRDDPNSIEINVNLGDYGLMCNAIHYIDLTEWLRNTRIKSIDLDITGVHPTKRTACFDINGVLKVTCYDNSELILQANLNDNEMGFQIVSLSESFAIDEVARTARSNKGFYSENEILYQSELTYPLISSLLIAGTCELPPFIESYKQHIKLLEAFESQCIKKDLGSIIIT